MFFFSKKPTFNFVNLFCCFLVLYFIYFCFIFFLLLLTLELLSSFFLVSWHIKLGYLIKIFVFLYMIIIITFLLELLWLHPTTFAISCFHFYLSQDVFLISLLISSLIHWLCKNVLFNFHVFVNFSVFFLLIYSSIWL